MEKQSSLTPQEVADILKIAKTTVYELIKRGELRAYHIGRKVRIDLKDVDAYKENKKGSLTTRTAPSLFDSSPPLQSEKRSDGKSIIISGQDIMLDILCRFLEMSPSKARGLRSHHGSYNALYAMYHGDVDAAGVHLWDGHTDTYNINYVKSLLPGVGCTLIHLACRKVGFYVQKGNPKNIAGWQDFSRNDISIVNREKGAGIRILLDGKLKQLGIDKHIVHGYENESQSHLAAAGIISQGGADLSVGNEKAALQVKGIDFIPQQTERYELAVKTEDMIKPEFMQLIEIINSGEYKKELNSLGGYDISETGQIVAKT